MFVNFWENSSLNYAALAIPAFFLFFAIEYTIARKRKQQVFNFEESLSNITIGIAERLLSLFLTGAFYGVFIWIYGHWAIWSIPNSWWVWAIMILFTDFIWYWYHRLGHEVNLMWAAHIVHHQSDDFNYTVSARITALQAIVRNLFWCVLPWIGFHPSMVMAILIAHGTYAFFTHTQLIGKLGFLEHFLITPSHHRVHHASNPQYLDKNYGDIFIFWDKMFGTFMKEDVVPTYGLTQPLKSYSFIWQHFHYFAELFYVISKTPGILNKVRVMLARPETLDYRVRTVLERQLIPRSTHWPLTKRLKIYLVLQVVVCVVILFLVTLLSKQIDFIFLIVSAVLILLSLINCGALLQQRRWIYYLEYLRLFIAIAYLSFFVGDPLLVIVSVVTIAYLAESESLRRRYFRFVYGR